MVRLGYVSGNRMSNLQARNVKLRDRAVRIVMAETGTDQATAQKALEAHAWSVQRAVQHLSSK